MGLFGFGKSKQFKGNSKTREYRLWKKFRYKYIAHKEANRARKEGYFARVIKEEGIWHVYIARK